MKIINVIATRILGPIFLISGLAGLGARAEEVIEGSGLFVEPGISYQISESTIDYPAPYSHSTATSRGFGAVLRGGVHVYQRFFVAADARYALLAFHDNANNVMTHASAWDIAPVLGVQMADYGLRLYGGYVLAGNLDPRSSNGVDLKFEDPNGWRVGAGLKLKQVSVNIEWQKLHYTTARLDGSPGGSFKHNSDGILSSVTFPIEFP